MEKTHSFFALFNANPRFIDKSGAFPDLTALIKNASGIVYDVVVDSTSLKPEEVVEVILKEMKDKHFL